MINAMREETPPSIFTFLSRMASSRGSQTQETIEQLKSICKKATLEKEDQTFLKGNILNIFDLMDALQKRNETTQSTDDLFELFEDKLSQLILFIPHCYSRINTNILTLQQKTKLLYKIYESLLEKHNEHLITFLYNSRIITDDSILQKLFFLYFDPAENIFEKMIFYFTLTHYQNNTLKDATEIAQLFLHARSIWLKKLSDAKIDVDALSKVPNKTNEYIAILSALLKTQIKINLISMDLEKSDDTQKNLFRIKYELEFQLKLYRLRQVIKKPFISSISSLFSTTRHVDEKMEATQTLIEYTVLCIHQLNDKNSAIPTLEKMPSMENGALEDIYKALIKTLKLSSTTHTSHFNFLGKRTATEPTMDDNELHLITPPKQV